MRYDEMIVMWRDGERRLGQAEADEKSALERATQAILQELRRKLGGPFTTQELASLYGEQGTDWCFDLAARAAPENPTAWDVPTVAGAAFARYAREASDYRTVRSKRPPGMEPE